ncbi:hypothetical protein HanPSC8_Chr13g0547231 [Helianthus annuus]|nr:hypothetical protein HanPSC8_Chr13g0547231 [Helianthus annuus]
MNSRILSMDIFVFKLHKVSTCIVSMGDVEPVDQKKYLEDSSKPKCVRPLIGYQI